MFISKTLPACYSLTLVITRTCTAKTLGLVFTTLLHLILAVRDLLLNFPHPILVASFMASTSGVRSWGPILLTCTRTWVGTWSRLTTWATGGSRSDCWARGGRDLAWKSSSGLTYRPHAPCVQPNRPALSARASRQQGCTR